MARCVGSFWWVCNLARGHGAKRIPQKIVRHGARSIQTKNAWCHGAGSGNLTRSQMKLVLGIARAKCLGAPSCTGSNKHKTDSRNARNRVLEMARSKRWQCYCPRKRSGTMPTTFIILNARRLKTKCVTIISCSRQLFAATQKADYCHHRGRTSQGFLHIPFKHDPPTQGKSLKIGHLKAMFEAPIAWSIVMVRLLHAVAC